MLKMFVSKIEGRTATAVLELVKGFAVDVANGYIEDEIGSFQSGAVQPLSDDEKDEMVDQYNDQ